MKTLKTLFGELVVIDAKDREEVKKLEKRVAQLNLENARLQEWWQNQYDLLSKMLSADVQELRLQRDGLLDELRVQKRYIETMKGLIRSIID